MPVISGSDAVKAHCQPEPVFSSTVKSQSSVTVGGSLTSVTLMVTSTVSSTDVSASPEEFFPSCTDTVTE